MPATAGGGVTEAIVRNDAWGGCEKWDGSTKHSREVCGCGSSRVIKVSEDKKWGRVLIVGLGGIHYQQIDV